MGPLHISTKLTLRRCMGHLECFCIYQNVILNGSSIHRLPKLWNPTNWNATTNQNSITRLVEYIYFVMPWLLKIEDTSKQYSKKPVTIQMWRYWIINRFTCQIDWLGHVQNSENLYKMHITTKINMSIPLTMCCANWIHLTLPQYGEFTTISNKKQKNHINWDVKKSNAVSMHLSNWWNWNLPELGWCMEIAALYDHNKYQITSSSHVPVGAQGAPSLVLAALFFSRPQWRSATEWCRRGHEVANPRLNAHPARTQRRLSSSAGCASTAR